MAKVVMSCGLQRAAVAGVHIAELGGNAVDAAIGGALMAMATTPGMVGLDAAGFVTVWPTDEAPRVIDGYTVMPGKGIDAEALGGGGREIEMDYGGYTRTIVGFGSVGVSGGLAAFEDAHRRWGTVPWKVLFEPVTDAVEQGFALPASSANYFTSSHDAVFGWLDHARPFVHRLDGSPLQVGDTVRMPDLADSLRALAEDGAATLYGGDLGQSLAAGIQAGGGILTVADLSEYTVVDRTPTRASFGDWHVATNPPPAVGGSVLAAFLLAASQIDVSASSAERTAAWVDIQDRILRYRRDRLDGASDLSSVARHMLEMAGRGDLTQLDGPPSTVHVSAVDDFDNACAITVSSGYGSGAMVEGTGIWLNNALGELELTGGEYHGLEPGARLMSNMTPTVARSVTGELLALGSGGAARITTAIGTVLFGHLIAGLELEEAVLMPRAHVEDFRGERLVAHETALPLPVGALGHLGRRDLGDLQMYFGGVHVAARRADGSLVGVGDPRRNGSTAIGGHRG
ncbi:MAG: gamma-glutamyltransferase [Actinobacteria bacterium]|nr:gamma-glutamyltransferase [Actinomycetota bacterium]